MGKTVKTPGAKMNCFTCKTELTCVEIPASGNYAAKLQWHDENGAHYGFDFKTNEPICKKNQPARENAQRAGEASQASGEIHLKDIDLSIEELEKIAKETNYMLKYQLARIFYIQEGVRKVGLNPSGPFVGMLFNQQMESLRSL
jgi:hypothetical protein